MEQDDRRKLRSRTSNIFQQYRQMERKQWEESAKRREEERGSGNLREEKEAEEKDAHGRKGRKVGKQFVFPMVSGSGVSKSRLPKVAGAEPSGQMRDEKCTPLRREAHVQVGLCNTQPSPTNFES